MLLSIDNPTDSIQITQTNPNDKVFIVISRDGDSCIVGYESLLDMIPEHVKAEYIHFKYAKICDMFDTGGYTITRIF